MKSYKIEGLIYYTQLTIDSSPIVKQSQADIQTKLDAYAQQGYRLASTSSLSCGLAVILYLFFEKDVE